MAKLTKDSSSNVAVYVVNLFSESKRLVREADVPPIFLPSEAQK